MRYRYSLAKNSAVVFGVRDTEGNVSLAVPGSPIVKSGKGSIFGFVDVHVPHKVIKAYPTSGMLWSSEGPVLHRDSVVLEDGDFRVFIVYYHIGLKLAWHLVRVRDVDGVREIQISERLLPNRYVPISGKYWPTTFIEREFSVLKFSGGEFHTHVANLRIGYPPNGKHMPKEEYSSFLKLIAEGTHLTHLAHQGDLVSGPISRLGMALFRPLPGNDVFLVRHVRGWPYAVGRINTEGELEPIFAEGSLRLVKHTVEGNTVTLSFEGEESGVLTVQVELDSLYHTLTANETSE